MKPWDHKRVKIFLKYGAGKEPRPATTVNTYRNDLTRFFKAAEIDSVAKMLKFDEFDALELRDRLKETMTPGTLRSTIITTKALYAKLEKAGLTKNPFMGMIIGAAPIPKWNVLEGSEEIKRILAAPKGKYKLRDRAILLALLKHAWRVTEFVQLTWGSIETHEGIRGVYFKAKGQAEDDDEQITFQPVNQEFLEAARKWSQNTDLDVPLVPKRRGFPVEHLTRGNVYNIVKKLSIRSVGRKVTPHGLRATAITQQAKLIGIEAARDLAGHTNIKTTERYYRSKVVVRGTLYEPPKQKKNRDWT